MRSPGLAVVAGLEVFGDFGVGEAVVVEPEDVEAALVAGDSRLSGPEAADRCGDDPLAQVEGPGPCV